MVIRVWQISTLPGKACESLFPKTCSDSVKSRQRSLDDDRRQIKDAHTRAEQVVLGFYDFGYRRSEAKRHRPITYMHAAWGHPKVAIYLR
jgi:hypothetical protein